MCVTLTDDQHLMVHVNTFMELRMRDDVLGIFEQMRRLQLQLPAVIRQSGEGVRILHSQTRPVLFEPIPAAPVCAPAQR